jgi:hypothetical protein
MGSEDAGNAKISQRGPEGDKAPVRFVPEEVHRAGDAGARNDMQGINSELWDEISDRTFAAESAFRLSDIERVRTTGWKRR